MMVHGAKWRSINHEIVVYVHVECVKLKAYFIYPVTQMF